MLLFAGSICKYIQYNLFFSDRFLTSFVYFQGPEKKKDDTSTEATFGKNEKKRTFRPKK